MSEPGQHEQPPPPALHIAGDAEVAQAVTTTGGSIGQVIGRQVTYNYYPVIDHPPDRNRAVMLAKVRRIWIDGLLTHTLVIPRLALAIEEHPNAVRLPLTAQYQELGRPPLTLPIIMDPRI